MLTDRYGRMNWGNSWKFALVLSILVHGVVIVLFLLLPAPTWMVAGKGGQEKNAGASDAVKRLVIRKQVENKVAQKRDEVRADEKEDKKKQPEFVKTSARQPKDDRLKEAPHVGSRSTKASGGPKAPDDMKEMPAQDGEKAKDGEVVLFDQDRQDGSLEHDDEGGAKASTPVVRRIVEKNAPRPVLHDPALAESNQTGQDVDDSSPLPESQEGAITSMLGQESAQNQVQNPIQNPDQDTVSQPEAPEAADPPEREESVKENAAGSAEDAPSQVDEADKGLVADGKEGERERKKDVPREAGEEEAKNDEDRQPQPMKDEADAVSQPGKSLMANDRVKSLPPVAESSKKQGEISEKKSGSRRSLLSPAGSGSGSMLPPPLTRKNKRPVYDPVFSEVAQPGFRTQERRTRTSGKFSFGRNPSLDVAATPMGRYQEIVYRAIAMVWYDQCDRNRDLIVTGTLRIRILLNPKGDVVSMKLLGRSGASVAQNSFTFVAIKAAPIPPMPPDVRKELVGDRMELFFDFNF